MALREAVSASADRFAPGLAGCRGNPRRRAYDAQVDRRSSNARGMLTRKLGVVTIAPGVHRLQFFGETFLRSAPCVRCRAICPA